MRNKRARKAWKKWGQILSRKPQKTISPFGCDILVFDGRSAKEVLTKWFDEGKIWKVEHGREVKQIFAQPEMMEEWTA